MNAKKIFFCPQNSKVRLVMYFKKGYINNYGNELEVQFSLLKMNNKPIDTIINSMENSFLYKKYPNKVRVALFYDNITGNVIKKIVDGIIRND